MDLKVKNLVHSYETLADQATKLNTSYLNLLKIYDELNLAPDFLSQLEASNNSPLKLIQSMQRDKEAMLDKFTDLAKLISQTQVSFTNNPEAEQLRAIAHDCQVMQKFISSIDLKDLQQMFVQLIDA
ncbi:MAG: hypothetical protein AAF630_10055 [Cyanobacteria bacterium P01_C01_bin.38]